MSQITSFKLELFGYFFAASLSGLYHNAFSRWYGRKRNLLPKLGYLNG